MKERPGKLLTPALALILLAMLLLAMAVSACAPIRSSQILTVGIYAGSYWGTPTGDSYKVLDDTISRFVEEHPEIRVEYVSGIGTDAYSEWLAQQILKGAEPDVYFILPEDFNLLVSSGALEPLDEFITADADFDVSAYYDACLLAGVYENCQYALPYESVPTMMFVNKTILDEHGITVPNNDWTWEDLYEICAQVTDVESHRFGIYDYDWVNALYSNGADLFSENGGTCYLSDGKIQESIRFVQRLEELNEGYNVTSRDFDLGRVAFRPFLFSEYRAYQPYPWRVKKYSGFEWECVCMPAGPGGGNASELSTMLLGISSRSKNTELAWEFVKLLSYDEDTQRELYTNSHGISPLTAVAESEDTLQQLYDSIPGSVNFSAEVIGDIMRTAVIMPRFDKYDQALAMAQNAVAETFSNGDVLQSRLQRAQREINIYLNR